MHRTFRVAEVQGDSAALRFGGAQWEVIREQVKALRSRRWDPERRAWILSAAEAAPILERFEFQVKRTRAVPTCPPPVDMPLRPERIEASWSVTSGLKLPPSRSGLVPRGYQAAGVEYILEDPRVLVGDEPGLGKTALALMAARESNAFPLVVVCPATLKEKWRREAVDWLWPGVDVQVLYSGKDRVRRTAEVVVVNYDLLQLSKGADGKRERRLDGLAARIRDLKLGGIVVDEVHFAKEWTARRTHATMLLADGLPFRLGLSGTPVVNRPTELACQLAILGRLGQFGGWKWFTTYYGFKDGAEDMDQLNRWLRSHAYLRREKRQGLPDLPEKSMVTLPVEIDNRAEYDQVQHDTVEWLRANDMGDRVAEQAKIEYLRQVAVKGKMTATFEWIDEFLATGEQLVVFAHHRATVDAVASRYRAPRIWGESSQRERDHAIATFQRGGAQLIACNLKAGGVGIDLYAASNLLFLEYPWTPAEFDQAVDRCHRQGQVSPVTAWCLVGRDTIDETMLAILERKRAIVDPAVRGLSVMRELIEEVRR